MDVIFFYLGKVDIYYAKWKAIRINRVNTGCRSSLGFTDSFYGTETHLKAKSLGVAITGTSAKVIAPSTCNGESTKHYLFKIEICWLGEFISEADATRSRTILSL